MRYLVTVGADSVELELDRRPDGSYRVRCKDGPELEVVPRALEPGLCDVQVDGQNVRVLPADGEVRFRQQIYAARSETWLDRARAGSGTSSATHSGKVVASMPGRIVQISCQVGQVVAVGAPLIVMEAMKMQNELSAKAAGTVRTIAVAVGQTVERGELLVEFE